MIDIFEAVQRGGQPTQKRQCQLRRTTHLERISPENPNQDKGQNPKQARERDDDEERNTKKVVFDVTLMKFIKHHDKMLPFKVYYYYYYYYYYAPNIQGIK